ncbi:TlpA family protein disulfide reductase [Flavobacteriaceae bacterium]|jgi:thiol-disulfide isomerase/thioredoxin|nr:TlpA family protein disulfide reductase [Flavobacteriaceae bacterium]MDA8625907.1 TlpA family protein disulfide reductase [Flavobacteriaceae bacterium]
MIYKANFKNYLFALLTISMIFSCNKSEFTEVIIQGNIVNPMGNTIQLVGPGEMEDGTLNLNFQRETNVDENGNFIDTLNLKSSGYFFFIHGRERTQLFLEPGDNLTINLDSKQFDESITFSGEGSENNTFLKKRFLFQENNGVNVIEMSKLESKEYLNKVDSLKQWELNFLKENQNISNNFLNIEKKNSHYKFLQALERYPLYHEFYAKKEAVYDESFMSPLKSIDYTNQDDYILFPDFKNLVMSYYQNIFNKSDNLKEDLRKLNLSKSTIIKRDLVNQGVYLLSAGNEKNKDLYETLIDLAKEFESTGIDSLTISKLTNKFNILRNLEKGMKSPVFNNYENFNGERTSLSDLKGKYVYIDVWATWCGPCIREIPSLKVIEKKYENKNIHFVSISIDERNRPRYNYEAWRKMIVEKELTGIQLFADNAFNSKFTKAYGIDSIPRFLLIDPDGNIVSGNAPRPSDPKLVELFNSLGI